MSQTPTGPKFLILRLLSQNFGTMTTVVTNSGMEASVKYVYRGHFLPLRIKEGVTHIQVDSSVKVIRFMAFEGCRQLQHVSIPKSVVVIEARAFFRCKNLREVIFETRDSDLQTIQEFAFAGCTSLKGIALPEGFQDRILCSSLFQNCTALEHVKLPPTIQTIGPLAFSGCTSLTNLDFLPKNSVRVIGANAFRDCAGLESLALPTSIEDIGNAAFFGCRGLLANGIDDMMIHFWWDVNRGGRRFLIRDKDDMRARPDGLWALILHRVLRGLTLPQRHTIQQPQFNSYESNLRLRRMSVVYFLLTNGDIVN